MNWNAERRRVSSRNPLESELICDDISVDQPERRDIINVRALVFEQRIRHASRERPDKEHEQRRNTHRVKDLSLFRPHKADLDSSVG